VDDRAGGGADPGAGAMTAVADGRASPEQVDTVERGLLERVLDALLREDHLGLATAGAPVTDPSLPLRPPGQPWWGAPLPGGRRVALPVRPDGFLADHAVAAPLLVVDGPGGRTVVSTLDGALAALAPAGDDADARAGWTDFAAECTQTLMTLRLHEVAGPALHARLTAEGPARGFDGLMQYEALAALRDHPVHPTGRCRWDLTEAELRRYAPEYAPEFPLQWNVVPRATVRLSPALAADGLPEWWPSPSELGAAPTRDADHLAVPVHPLTADRGRPAVAAGLTVTPTLSTRTVALFGEPGVHLKLPLPTATLGRRNRRSIAPGTLADGDTVHRLLAAILRREPGLGRGVLLADESCWIDSSDEMLAVLVRRYPAELATDRLVPVAALLAPDPHAPGASVLDGLADGDTPAWFDRYLEVLLNWHVALWLRYGVALEAHQQNITVAMGDDGLRLVYKDDDGARIDCARLAAALGPDAPLPVRPEAFHDRRIAVSEPVELADMVITITLHLCVGALVVEHAGPDADRRAQLFTLARARIEEAAQRWCDPADAGSVAAADLLRRHLLDAQRWPVKAMITAGTLLPKNRLGCTDVNKHYRRSGPNYLRAPRDAREV
jgi:siderophore synthetase component